MIVIENPSKEDDELGYLLTGRPGKMLETVLKKAGLSSKEIYLTSLVKCRSKYTKKQATFCADTWLKTEIAENKPRAIICLSKLAMSVVLEVPLSAIKSGMESTLQTTPVFLADPISSLLNRGRKLTDNLVEILKRAQQT